MEISVVLNTLNCQENLAKALKSIEKIADEIIVCDDGSGDKTLEIAKEFNAKIFHHKGMGYVEPARNFAIERAQGPWILLLDCDEEIPTSLSSKLKELASGDRRSEIDYVLIPRKNIIFGKWIKHTGWWPDYNVRFFKKGRVTFSNKIHEQPQTQGREWKLADKESLAIVHHNYQTIGQFLERVNKYTDIEARELLDSGYKFSWIDLFKKPDGEFLSRFFAQEGYKDGIHGFILSSLQSLSFFVTYIKVWELQGRIEQAIDLKEFEKETFLGLRELKHWLFKSLGKSEGRVRKFLYRLLGKS